MHYVVMVIVGLIVGILARFFYPGAVHMSLIASAYSESWGHFSQASLDALCILLPASSHSIRPGSSIPSSAR